MAKTSGVLITRSRAGWKGHVWGSARNRWGRVLEGTTGEGEPPCLSGIDWVSWLGERDVQVLLITLMRSLEDGIPLESLTGMVGGWRANAHRALRADDDRASVDQCLEVTVDARVYLLRCGRIGDEEGGEDDYPGL